MRCCPDESILDLRRNVSAVSLCSALDLGHETPDGFGPAPLRPSLRSALPCAGLSGRDIAEGLTGRSR